ncbi:hypothetical protein P171DRAFT_448262 [Karstenula rhodostoma CBS 690.94]|uniref:Uncharacterized protein n=1 Tax=Karstenula rhodostoma CBS 690.94 TaxID=1392251 RepID=A0A9P4PAH4_9PLEO|nr:hypothetical protein P171DRAFT_448262 [Karstenula rhodostoma CBS 690.94]
MEDADRDCEGTRTAGLPMCPDPTPSRGVKNTPNCAALASYQGLTRTVTQALLRRRKSKLQEPNPRSWSWSSSKTYVSFYPTPRIGLWPLPWVSTCTAINRGGFVRTYSRVLAPGRRRDMVCSHSHPAFHGYGLDPSLYDPGSKVVASSYFLGKVSGPLNVPGYMTGEAITGLFKLQHYLERLLMMSEHHPAHRFLPLRICVPEDRSPTWLSASVRPFASITGPFGQRRGYMLSHSLGTMLTTAEYPRLVFYVHRKSNFKGAQTAHRYLQGCWS